MRSFLLLFFMASFGLSTSALEPTFVQYWNIELYKKNCDHISLGADRSKVGVLADKAYVNFCSLINSYITYGYLSPESCKSPLELETLSREIDKIPVGINNIDLRNSNGRTVYNWARIITGICINPSLD